MRPEVGVVAQHLQARILEQGLHRVAGRTEGAQRLVQRASAWLVRDGADRGYWSWMQRSFGLREPHREGRAAPTSEAGPAGA